MDLRFLLIVLFAGLRFPGGGINCGTSFALERSLEAAMFFLQRVVPALGLLEFFLEMLHLEVGLFDGRPLRVGLFLDIIEVRRQRRFLVDQRLDLLFEGDDGVAVFVCLDLEFFDLLIALLQHFLDVLPFRLQAKQVGFEAA